MKKIYFLCISVSFLINAYSQDPLFLNSNQSLIYLNPSFAGSNGFLRNQFSYRNEWPALSGNSISYLNSIDAYIKPIKAGVAFSVYSDDMAGGIFKNQVYSLSYAQHISFLKGKLKVIPSLQLSYGIKTIDLSKMTFDQMNPGFVWNTPEAIPSPTKKYFDMSSGLLVNYNKNLYIGASFFHVNQPDVGMPGVSKLPLRLSMYSSYNWVINEQSIIQFVVNSQFQQKYTSNKFGVNMVNFKYLVTGIGAASGNVVFVNAGYRNNYFSMVFGYDVVYSKLAGNTAGSWEVHASFNLRNKDQRKTLTNFESW